LHRVRSSDTRDNAFVEARPGRKKISRNLLHAISPHSPGFILLACPSSSIDFEPRHSGFVRFTSNCKLLADRQGVSGVVAESSRSRPGWQFYINKSTRPTRQNPAGVKNHAISSGSTESHSIAFTLSIIAIAATNFQTYYRTSVSNRCHARCSSVSCTYPGIDVGGFKLPRLISCDQPNSYSR
jgi:hypothetical protein